MNVNQYRYEDLKKIHRAMDVAKGGKYYAPFLRAMRHVPFPLKIDGNTFNLARTLVIDIGNDDGPYIQILDMADSVEWAGTLAQMLEQTWKEPFESSFAPDAMWFLLNRDQVLAALGYQGNEERELVDEALAILKPKH